MRRRGCLRHGPGLVRVMADPPWVGICGFLLVGLCTISGYHVNLAERWPVSPTHAP